MNWIVFSLGERAFIIWKLLDGGLREAFIWAAPFAPFSTAFVAVIAGAIAWLNYWHRRAADNRTYEHQRVVDHRAEWWRRVQSAINLATADSDQIGRGAGIALLSHLADDPDLTPRDLELILDVLNNLMDEVIWASDE